MQAVERLSFWERYIRMPQLSHRSSVEWDGISKRTLGKADPPFCTRFPRYEIAPDDHG
jgi:hypothetical protein